MARARQLVGTGTHFVPSIKSGEHKSLADTAIMNKGGAEYFYIVVFLFSLSFNIFQAVHVVVEAHKQNANSPTTLDIGSFYFVSCISRHFFFLVFA
jgi:hypothetical protein